MDLEDFEDLFGAVEKARAHEDQAQGHRMGLELPVQMRGPLLEAGFVEASRPMRRCGILVTHEWKLVAWKRVVNGGREIRKPKVLTDGHQNKSEWMEW